MAPFGPSSNDIINSILKISTLLFSSASEELSETSVYCMDLMDSQETSKHGTSKQDGGIRLSLVAVIAVLLAID